jgi:uncharacterized membrane protein YraQ (UPF0718 family)/copper chaperone CopZ
MPLCSCGVIPAGLGLKKQGASDGAAVGFLISTPQTGVDSLLVSASFLGWPFAAFKVFSAVVTGLAGGLLVEAAGGAGAREEVAASSEGHADRSWRGMWAHGVEMLRTIWRWLLFGVVASAAISTFVPPDLFASLSAGGGLLAFGVVLALSVPLYVCATASVPIAAALVGAGMPTGAALVFLMAGPATNLATIGAIYRGFGAKVAGIYLGTIVVGSAGLGLAFDALFDARGAVGSRAHAHEAWWAAASAVVLLVLIAWFAVEDARAWWGRRAAARARGARLEIVVEGMTCEGCSGRLQRVLGAAEGVESAAVSLEEGRAVLTGPISEAAARALIRQAGFKPA